MGSNGNWPQFSCYWLCVVWQKATKCHELFYGMTWFFTELLKEKSIVAKDSAGIFCFLRTILSNEHCEKDENHYNNILSLPNWRLVRLILSLSSYMFGAVALQSPSFTMLLPVLVSFRLLFVSQSRSFIFYFQNSLLYHMYCVWVLKMIASLPWDRVRSNLTKVYRFLCLYISQVHFPVYLFLDIS